LGIPFPSELAAPAGGEDRVHRLEVANSGVRVSQRALPTATPLRLITVATCHPGYPHKTTDREAFLRAESEAGAEAGGAALLLTAEGLVAEGSIWCLFWWEEGRVAAPPLDLGILEGVSRTRIAELAGPIVERQARPGDLRGCSIFLANAVRGIVEPVTWDGDPVPASAATGRLREAFWP
jgi:branched-subunit amino acid aminotransferase/4-amino-4-deoxychorismate lyase